MRELGFELAVGDSVHLADRILTVIDIHGEEITFRLDYVDATQEELLDGTVVPMPSDLAAARQPR